MLKKFLHLPFWRLNAGGKKKKGIILYGLHTSKSKHRKADSAIVLLANMQRLEEILPFASFAQTIANKCWFNYQILGICQKVMGPSPGEQNIGADESQVVLLLSTPALDCILCQNTTLGRDISTSPIASASGKEQGQEHSTAPPPPQGCLHPREVPEISSTGRQPWGSEELAAHQLIPASLRRAAITHCSHIPGAPWRQSSLSRLWHLSNSRTLGYKGLTQDLIQRIPSQQNSFHRLSIWVHSGFPDRFHLQFRTTYINIDLRCGEKEGRGRGKSQCGRLRKLDTALQSSGTPFFSHKERKLMTPQV